MSEKSVRKLKRFPKELRRNFWRAADWRFLYILLFSFLTTGATVAWFVQHFPRRDSDFVIEIQNRYVHRLLESSRSRTSSENVASSADAAKWVDWLFQDSLVPDSTLSVPADAQPRDQSTGGQPKSYEARQKARAADDERRKRGQDDAREEIEKVGLLGLLTSRRDAPGPKTVSDILNYADSTSLNLKNKLEKITRLEVPRPGTDFFGRGLGKDRNIYLAERAAKENTRIKETKVKPEKFVAGLAKTREHVVTKNKRFEQISEEPPGGVLGGLKRKIRRRYARRTTKHIKETVVGHNTAIQDCYRSALKDDPKFKGKVTVRVTVDILGRVSVVKIVSSKLNNADLQNNLKICIIDKITKWNDFGEVPESEGGLTFSHVYVFGKD